MKYISILFFLILISLQCYSQNSPLEGFMDGKSVVLISSAPSANPIISLDSLAMKIHGALLEAGGDPVAYFELEDIILSEETQAGYSSEFAKRLIKNIIIITRKENAEMSIHIMPFTQDKNMVSPGTAWSTSAGSLEEFTDKIAVVGINRKSKNILVIDVPEFIQNSSETEVTGNSTQFLSRNPLNLNVFKLGVPLSGASGDWAYLTTFRYDLLGKSPEQILSEQQIEKDGLEKIFETYYPFEVEFLTIPKSDEVLLKDRVQFVLMRIEGREADLMKSMGLEIPETIEKDRIVVKYYIKFLVRQEMYIGPAWDADPKWDTALVNFLKNLKI